MLKDAIRNGVHRSARIMTDELAAAVKKPIDDPGSAVDIAFEQVCSMFDRHLLRLHKKGNTQRGVIVFDKATYETQIQSLAIHFRTFGHRFGVIRNLSEVPLFLDSKASRLVQLADLIAFACSRFYERHDSRFIDIIKDRFNSGAGANGLVYIDNRIKSAKGGEVH
jgi:hypothetical protein